MEELKTKEILSSCFVTLVRKEKVQTADRGTITTVEKEVERVALDSVIYHDNHVEFSADGHTFSVFYKISEGFKEFCFSGEPDCSYEFRLPAVEDEAIFGGGEQFRDINLRGAKVRNVTSEHSTTKLIKRKIFYPERFYPRVDPNSIATYAPMPVFVTSNHRLIWFDTYYMGVSVFGESWYSFTFDGCPERLIILQDNTFEGLMKRFNVFFPNRQQIPNWCYDGIIMSSEGGTKLMLKRALRLQRAGIEVAGIWCQDWCGKKVSYFGRQVDWTWQTDEKDYKGLKEAIAKLKERSIKFLAYNNPRLSRNSKYYSLYEKNGWFVKRLDGSICQVRSTYYYAGLIDLTNPEALEFTKNVLFKNMLEMGISGWTADFGEYLPPRCILHEGNSLELHNKWPVLWGKLNYDAIKEHASTDDIFFTTRAGYTGIQQYVQSLWNGDQLCDFTKDYGVPSVLPATFSLGFSGVPVVHSDIGGFWSYAFFLRRNTELFVRSMEIGTFSPVMRSHIAIWPWIAVQFGSPFVRPHTRRLSKVHKALKPYLKACVEQAGEGIPVMRPDFWADNDFKTHHDEYSYFLGDDIFVAPVVERHKRKRTVWLPSGNWCCFWTDKPYKGGNEYTVKAPLGKPPVFYRSESKYREIFQEAAEHNR